MPFNTHLAMEAVSLEEQEVIFAILLIKTMRFNVHKLFCLVLKIKLRPNF